jgi:DNA polymerase sigma
MDPYLDTVKVEVYGSMATGLAIDSSDLDILVSDFIDQSSPRFKGLTRQELIEEMQMIHQALNDIYALKSNNLIESASVPVIKMQINLV